MKSNTGMIILVIVVVIGIVFLGTAFLKDDNAIDCPVGQTWSEAHQHCH